MFASCFYDLELDSVYRGPLGDFSCCIYSWGKTLKQHDLKHTSKSENYRVNYCREKALSAQCLTGNDAFLLFCLF